MTNTIWSECTERGRESIVVRFPVTDHDETVERARTEHTTDQWKQRYAIRAGIEGTIHQAVATTDIRCSRYLGLALAA